MMVDDQVSTKIRWPRILGLPPEFATTVPRAPLSSSTTAVLEVFYKIDSGPG